MIIHGGNLSAQQPHVPTAGLKVLVHGWIPSRLNLNPSPAPTWRRGLSATSRMWSLLGRPLTKKAEVVDAQSFDHLGLEGVCN